VLSALVLLSNIIFNISILGQTLKPNKRFSYFCFY